MTHKVAEGYRDKLRRLQDRLSHDLSDLEVEAPMAPRSLPTVESEPGDDGDSSVNLYEELVNLSLVENEAELLREVSDALERFDEGRFGRCEACHGAIEPARLEAIPYSRYCAACAARSARRT